jgi:micrococcal nuclease
MNKILINTIVGLVLVIALLVLNEGSILQTLGLTDSYKPKSNTQLAKNNSIEKSQVRRVVDGDTVELSNGQKIRLLNIDTPETVKANTPIMCYGREASDFTKKLLTDKNVQLVSDREANDQYGRGLRFIFLDGVDTDNIENSINADLVKNGFARAVSYKPNITYIKDFQNWESQAKSKNLGIWANCKKPFVE